MTGGQGFFILGEARFPTKVHDLLIVPPNTEHTEASDINSPLEYIVLGIDSIEFLNPENPTAHIIYNYRNNPGFLQLLHFLLMEVETKKAEYPQVCQNLLEILLIMILRTQQLIPASVSSAKMTKECSTIKHYLNSNFSETINLDTLADMTHMNKYYLVHAFTKYTGYSPMNYLIRTRLQASEDLLSSTNISIAQIASAVGFSSQSYFAQVFKKTHGITPIEYRRTHSEKYDFS